jgi:undecaprenyl-diphosphatase
MTAQRFSAASPLDNRHDFRVVNDFARSSGWLHGFFTFFATYGIVLFVFLLLFGWWRSRHADAPALLPRLLWAPIAALLAVAINQPIVSAVHERRPFVALPHVLTLVSHAPDPGFPSDHATACGALAVGLLIASRRLGAVAALIALLVAFARVYVGVHYPGDVLGGLALGAAVAAIGAVPATWLLTRGTEAVGHSRLAPLVTGRSATPTPVTQTSSSGSETYAAPDSPSIRNR